MTKESVVGSKGYPFAFVGKTTLGYWAAFVQYSATHSAQVSNPFETQGRADAVASRFEEHCKEKRNGAGGVLRAAYRAKVGK